MKKNNIAKIAGVVAVKAVGYGVAYRAYNNIPVAVAESLIPYIGVWPACSVGVCVCGIEPIITVIAIKKAHKRLDPEVVKWFKKLASEENDDVIEKDGETYIKYQILDSKGEVLKVDFAKVEGL